jgi:hypothetical protein
VVHSVPMEDVTRRLHVNTQMTTSHLWTGETRSPIAHSFILSTKHSHSVAVEYPR